MTKGNGKMTRLEELQDRLEELNDELAEWVSMEEFDEIMSGYTPLEIAQKVFYGNFHYCDDYFRFDGYANLETSAEWEIEELENKIASIQSEIDELENSEL